MLSAARHHSGVLNGDVPGKCMFLNIAALRKKVFAVSCFHQAYTSPYHTVVSSTDHTWHGKTEAEEPYDAVVIPLYIFERKEENICSLLCKKVFQQSFSSYIEMHITTYLQLEHQGDNPCTYTSKVCLDKNWNFPLQVA